MLGRPLRRGFAASLSLAALLTALAVPGRIATAFDASEIDAALSTVGSGFASPILVANAGDGSQRLFVVGNGDADSGHEPEHRLVRAERAR